jgi:hypothetical protein
MDSVANAIATTALMQSFVSGSQLRLDDANVVMSQVAEVVVRIQTNAAS